MFGAPLAIQTLEVVTVYGVYWLLAVVGAAWVFMDNRARGMGGGRSEGSLGWALATLLVLPISLPVYLLWARPTGQLVVCPTCQRSTLSHRAACVHCGSSLAFDSPPAMWGLGEVVGVVIIFITLLAVVAMIVGVAGTLPLAALSALVVVQNALFVALTVYVVRKRYRQSLSALGIRWERWRPLIGLGAGVGLAAVAISAAAESAATSLITAIIGHGRAEALAAAERARDIVTDTLHGPLTVSGIIWVFFLVCVIVPIGEEIFFRGFVYAALRARRGVPAAVGLSALLFAVVHQQVFHFFPIFVLGLILAVLYQRTQTLLPAIVVHGVNNVVAVLAILRGWNF